MSPLFNLLKSKNNKVLLWNYKKVIINFDNYFFCVSL
nr:MAG TPA: hypothetical protein [Bacteriophage sp.]